MTDSRQLTIWKGEHNSFDIRRDLDRPGPRKKDVMPRRRMLDPSFFDDPNIATLTMEERLFLIGCIRNSDDEGRLKGHPAYLKAEIFMYDDSIDLERMKRIKESALRKMEDWPEDNLWKLAAYKNHGSDYLCFLNWYEQQRPSHPSPSKLPAPPEGISRKPQEVVQKSSRDSLATLPKDSRLGQSSQGQYSLGQYSQVKIQEDFRKFSKNSADLTDFLTRTMKKYIALGRERMLAASGTGLGGGGGPGELPPDKETFNRAQMGILVIEEFWKQLVGTNLPSTLWHGAHEALKQHPIEVLARAFVKAGPYQGGKHKSWKYLQKIIDEELQRR